MSIEGAFIEGAKHVLGEVFSGDGIEFGGQNAAIDSVAEAAEGVIREYEASPESMAKLMAMLVAAGATILSAVFVGGRWVLKVRFG